MLIILCLILSVGAANLEFYGDSFTVGVGANNTMNKFSTILSGRLNMTELNYGITGAMLTDGMGMIYTKHTPGTPSVLEFGANEVIRMNANHTQEWELVLECAVLFLTLPNVKMFQYGNMPSGITISSGWYPAGWANSVTGTMRNIYGGKGLWTGSSTPQTITIEEGILFGQYIVFGTTVDLRATTTQFPQNSDILVTLSVDGVIIGPQQMVGGYPSSGLGFGTLRPQYGYQQISWLYDMGQTSTHKYVFTITLPSPNPGQWCAGVDWVAAFSPNQTNTTPVFIMSQPPIRRSALEWYKWPSNVFIDSLDVITKKKVKIYQDIFQLPIYFLDVMTYNPTSQSYDHIHPNDDGHNWIAQRSYEQMKSFV